MSSTEDTIARWRAEESAVRARLGEPGYARAEQVRGRTGVQMLQAIFAGELPRPPIGDTLDFVPIHMDPGVAVFQGRPQLKHYNPLGSVHGGGSRRYSIPRSAARCIRRCRRARATPRWSSR